MDNLMQDLESLVAALKVDFIKFQKKGNNAAGTRLRKKLQVIVALSKEMRKAVAQRRKIVKDIKSMQATASKF